MFAGAANIDDGVTIDLGQLNQVTLSEDRRSVTIGPGNTWGRVYESLPAGLATGGGRVSNVGVGGLTLGGKIAAEILGLRYQLTLMPTRRHIVFLKPLWLRLRHRQKLRGQYSSGKSRDFD